MFKQNLEEWVESCRDDAGNIVSRLRVGQLGNCGSNPCKGQGILSLAKASRLVRDQLWKWVSRALSLGIKRLRVKLYTCLYLVLSLSRNEVNIYAFPCDFMALTRTKLKGKAVGSISITSTWKMLARKYVNQVAPTSVSNKERPARSIQSLSPCLVIFVSKVLQHANVQDRTDPRRAYSNPLLVRDSRCWSVASGIDGRARTQDPANTSTALAAQICQEHQVFRIQFRIYRRNAAVVWFLKCCRIQSLQFYA